MQIDHLVVINDFVGGGGGAAELAVFSAVAFKRNGTPVTFIGGDLLSDARLDECKIPLISCKQKSLLDSQTRNLVRGIYNRVSAELVGAWIQTNDTPRTVYHLHNWSQILSPSIFIALKPVAHRLVMTAHDFFIVCPNGAFCNYPQARVCELKPMSLSCIACDCDRRSYHHKLWRVARQGVADHFRKRFLAAARITVLHEAMVDYLERGGVPRHTIRTLRNPVRAFSETRVPVEMNRKFFYIGRLHEGKGPDLFLEAAKIARAQAVLVGDGPQRNDLSRQFPTAEITGWRKPHEVAQLVREARAIVVPSRYPEPFGLTALEAANSGIPVIISSSAMLAPELEAVGAAVSVDPRNITAFATAISHMDTSDDLVRSMSERAFCGTRKFGTQPDEWVLGLKNLYEELLCDSSQN